MKDPSIKRRLYNFLGKCRRVLVRATGAPSKQTQYWLKSINYHFIIIIMFNRLRIYYLLIVHYYYYFTFFSLQNYLLLYWRTCLRCLIGENSIRVDGNQLSYLLPFPNDSHSYRFNTTKRNSKRSKNRIGKNWSFYEFK